MCDVTKVMFRKFFRKEDQMFGEDQVIAIFPEEKEHRPGMVMSFMHHGQHGAADIESIMRITKPAKPNEYAALKRELERPPYEYRFKVILRRPH